MTGQRAAGWREGAEAVGLRGVGGLRGADTGLPSTVTLILLFIGTVRVL